MDLTAAYARPPPENEIVTGFGHAISKTLLDNIPFDFWQEGKSTFESRARQYDKLIEFVIEKEYCPFAAVSSQVRKFLAKMK
jgi:hypothetical protein